MKILVLNSGTSFIRFQLWNMLDEIELLHGQVLKIGLSGSCIDYHVRYDDYHHFEDEIRDHADALRQLCCIFNQACISGIECETDIRAVVHFIPHGGAECVEPAIITNDVKAVIRKYFEFSEYRNAAALRGIEAAESILPEAVQIGVFDTGFSQSMEPKAYMYGLPYEYYTDLGIRRYGFHGLVHQHAMETACHEIDADPAATKMIISNLGTENSISAIENGRCVDISNGFSYSEGPMMAVSCGDCDPSIVPIIYNNKGMSLQEVMNVLKKKSGMMAYCNCLGHTKDMEYLLTHADDRARLAMDMQVYTIQKYIGAYIAALNGADVLVFTGINGVTNPRLREEILANFEYAGWAVDNDANARCNWHTSSNSIISSRESKAKIVVVDSSNAMVDLKVAYRLATQFATESTY